MKPYALLDDLAKRPQDTWTPQEVSQLFLFACGCDNLIAASARSEIAQPTPAPCACYPEGNSGDCPAPGCNRAPAAGEMTVKEAAERVRAFADHRSLDNIRTDQEAPWREAMKVCAEALSAVSASREPKPYDVMADAVCEIADAARQAFVKAGFDPGEWDSDNIVQDVKNGLVSAIETLAARSATAPTKIASQAIGLYFEILHRNGWMTHDDVKAAVLREIEEGESTCMKCGGSGEISVQTGGGPDAYLEAVGCPTCRGTGVTVDRRNDDDPDA